MVNNVLEELEKQLQSLVEKKRLALFLNMKTFKMGNQMIELRIIDILLPFKWLVLCKTFLFEKVNRLGGCDPSMVLGIAV